MAKQDKLQQHNVHDNFFKSLFLIKENLEDLLSGTLPKDIEKQVRLETLEYDPTEYVDSKLTPYFKDISCNVLYGGKESNVKISLLYEHKSYPDKDIHLQLLRYILNIWENQVSNKQELTPVITMVFYHGKPKWNNTGFIKKIPEELKRFVPLFDYVLFDTKEVEDNTIIQHFKKSTVKVAIWFLKRSNNIIDFIQKNPEISRNMFSQLNQVDENILEKFALYLYDISGLSTDEISSIMETISPQTKQAFAHAYQRLTNEGIKNIIAKMINKGYSDIQISEITEMSVQEIRAIRRKNR